MNIFPAFVFVSEFGTTALRSAPRAPAAAIWRPSAGMTFFKVGIARNSLPACRKILTTMPMRTHTHKQMPPSAMPSAMPFMAAMTQGIAQMQQVSPLPCPVHLHLLAPALPFFQGNFLCSLDTFYHFFPWADAAVDAGRIQSGVEGTGRDSTRCACLIEEWHSCACMHVHANGGRLV